MVFLALHPPSFREPWFDWPLIAAVSTKAVGVLCLSFFFCGGRNKSCVWLRQNQVDGLGRSPRTRVSASLGTRKRSNSGTGHPGGQPEISRERFGGGSKPAGSHFGAGFDPWLFGCIYCFCCFFFVSVCVCVCFLLEGKGRLFCVVFVFCSGWGGGVAFLPPLCLVQNGFPFYFSSSPQKKMLCFLRGKHAGAFVNFYCPK